MKIDVMFFIENIFLIVSIFVLVLILKSIIIYGVLRGMTTHSTSLKTALALSQVGEFSFVIFAVALSGGILDKELTSLFILIVIFSMMVTPFFISKINKTVDKFTKNKYFTPDISKFAKRKDHVIVCGYSVIGKFVALHLDELDAPYIVVDNSPKHVQEAVDAGIEAYLGDVSKLSMLDTLHAKSSAAVIVTLDNIDKKRSICEAIVKYTRNINLIVKVNSLKDKQLLDDLGITTIVDSKVEVSRVLVERMITCQLKYK